MKPERQRDAAWEEVHASKLPRPHQILGVSGIAVRHPVPKLLNRRAAQKQR